ncbi:MAG: tRNA lysidine(34) synthetase TilS, partial [bacterium]
MNKILNTIQNTIDKYKMISSYDKILLGISGGPDSVMLFMALYFFMKKYKFSFICAHLNYKLRGKESFEDQEFVKSLCEQFKIPCFIKEINIAELSKKKGGIEEIAREERYKFFLKQAKKNKANKIATAHTQNDNIETILMYFLRGTGINGLQGIPIVRDNIIRPLLNISRKEILEFLNDNKIKFRIDSTNSKNIYFRNKIRNNFLPYLKKNYNPNIDNVLLNTSSIIKEENKYLYKIVKQKYEKIIKNTFSTKIILNLDEFLKNDIVIQKRIIINCFKNLKIKEIYYQHLENIILFLKNGKTTSFINLPNKIVIKK